MYVNLELFRSKKLHPEDLYYLVGIKLKDIKVLEELTTDAFTRFEEAGLLTSIKGKKGDNLILNIRLSDKGKKFLLKLSHEGAVDEEADKIKEWVISVYKSKNGGIVKNKTELGRRIYWFKTITKIEGNFLAVLIQSAMADTYDPECGLSFYDFKKDNPRAILSNLAENLFWMPSSHFDKNYTVDKSPLYTYFEDNEDYIKQVWEVSLNNDGSRRK